MAGRLAGSITLPAGRRRSLSGGFFKLAIARFLSRAPPARAIFSILKQLYIRAPTPPRLAADGRRRRAIEPPIRAPSGRRVCWKLIRRPYHSALLRRWIVRALVMESFCASCLRISSRPGEFPSQRTHTHTKSERRPRRNGERDGIGFEMDE